MAQLRWGSSRLPEAFAEFELLRGELGRLFGLDRWADSGGLLDRAASLPIDVIDKAEELVVLANIPGIERKDIDLSLAANILTIKGEKRPAEGKKRVFREETWAGSFQRTLALPDSVDSDKVQAELRDGVLRVVIGKRAELKPRQIAVNIK